MIKFIEDIAKCDNLKYEKQKLNIEPLPGQPSEVQVRDEDDRWVLESALRAKADVLITGDKDLLDISKQVPQLKIVTPREFWELVQK